MKKILIVDDERHIVRLVQVNVEREGYETVTAFDGVEALEKVKTENPDIVIMDWTMPRMDGMECLKRLAANPKTEKIPVIMLTARAQDGDIFTGWQSGVSYYLTKPFTPQELLLVLKRVVEYMEDPTYLEGDDSEPVYDV